MRSDCARPWAAIDRGTRDPGAEIGFQLIEKKGEEIRFLRNPIAKGGADSVAGAGGRAKEDGVFGMVRRLEARGHFARIIRVDPPIVLPGGEEHGRIISSVVDMM